MAKIPKQQRWLFTVAKKLRQTRGQELDEQHELILFQHALERTKNGVLFNAIGSDLITGKNAELRKIQTEQLLLEAPAYQIIIQDFEQQEHVTKSIAITRRYYEDLLKIGLVITGKEDS